MNKIYKLSFFATFLLILPPKVSASNALISQGIVKKVSTTSLFKPLVTLFAKNHPYTQVRVQESLWALMDKTENNCLTDLDKINHKNESNIGKNLIQSIRFSLKELDNKSPKYIDLFTKTATHQMIKEGLNDFNANMHSVAKDYKNEENINEINISYLNNAYRNINLIYTQYEEFLKGSNISVQEEKHYFASAIKKKMDAKDDGNL